MITMTTVPVFLTLLNSVINIQHVHVIYFSFISPNYTPISGIKWIIMLLFSATNASLFKPPLLRHGVLSRKPYSFG